MSIELSLPAKAALGASAAAGTSLAAAGAGGAFSSGAQLEKVEGNKEDLVEEGTSEDEVTKQLQNITEDSQEPRVDTDRAPDTDEGIVEGPHEPVSRESFSQEDKFTGLINKESQLVTLVSQDQTQKYDEGTIGQKYSRFLVSVKGNEQDGNKEWWNEKLEEYKTSLEEDHVRSEDSPFNKKQNLNLGYDENLSENSLNGLCHLIYQIKKTDTELKKQPSVEPKNPKITTYSIWKDFWMFCSPEKFDPYYIGDSNSDFQPKPEKDDVISYQFKSQLLSTHEEEPASEDAEIENKFIWEKLNYHFFETEDVEDPYFKSFKDKNLSTYPSSAKVLLKGQCEKAYKIQKTVEVGENRPSDEALLKYCSLGK